MFIHSVVDIGRALDARGFVLVRASQFDVDDEARTALSVLARDWETLPLDQYLRGLHSHRRRRYGRYSYSVASGELKLLEHHSFYQSKEINRFAGGTERLFGPLTRLARHNEFLRMLVRFNAQNLPNVAKDGIWTVGVHQIRVLANRHFAGNPTPEGIHRDGFQYFSVHLIRRVNIQSGGVTSIFSGAEEKEADFMLASPLDSMYADDCRVLHCVSEIHAADGANLAYRDVLILTYE